MAYEADCIRPNGTREQASKAPDCMLPKGALQRSNSGPFQFVHTFTRDNPGNIEDFYQFQKVLGKGAYGSAHCVTCKETGLQRAVKCIPLVKVKDPKRLEVEIAIARQLDHPNVVRLFETFRDSEKVYLVMELCTGGELFERIMEEAPEGFDEVRASGYVRQILAALAYIHANDFAHRDVKPENFLLRNSSPGAELKLIDFGLARQFRRGNPMETKVGTPYYVAPEVLSGAYDSKCDVWSAGVLAYILLCGYPPFHGDSDKDVLRRVKRGTFCFPSPDWDGVSQAAKQLVQRLLTADPSVRPSAAAALRSPWLQRLQRKMGSAQAASLGADFVEKLEEFRAQTRMKRVALTAVAQQLPDDDLGALQAAFRSLDEDGDGMLSPSDVQEGLAKSGFGSSPELDELLRSADSSGSGSLDYTEFLAAMVDENLYAQRSVCWAAFRTFDLDGDGKISQDELEHVLGAGDPEKSPGKSRIQRMMSEADSTGDGCIDFEEFYTVIKTVSPTKLSKLGASPSRSPKGIQEEASVPVHYLESLDIRSALFVER